MQILENILLDKPNRMKLISKFQDDVWDDADCNQILKELAHDLSFYEPDEALRSEDPVYYGDDRLEQEIKTVLQKLRQA